VALLTIVSKLHFRNGLVRISAGMVGILLNLRSPRRTPTSLGLPLGRATRVRMRCGVCHVRIVDGRHSAEADARTDELQIPDRAGR